MLEKIMGMLTNCLRECGLTLFEEKILITHITEGFDSWGFNVRKYNGALLIKPFKKSRNRFAGKLHEVVLEKNKAVA